MNNTNPLTFEIQGSNRLFQKLMVRPLELPNTWITYQLFVLETFVCVQTEGLTKSKNVVCAFQSTYRLLSFSLEDS